MQFQTGNRWRSGSLVIRPSRQILDVNSGHLRAIPPLRVPIKEHRIDTESIAKTGVWDDWAESNGMNRQAVIHFVDEYIQNHEDFGRTGGRGIFIDQSVKQVSQQEIDTKVAAGEMEQVCMHLIPMGDETVQCGEPVAEGSDFCRKHEEEVAASL